MDVSIIMISLAMACAAFILTMAHATNGMDVMAKFQVAAAASMGFLSIVIMASRDKGGTVTAGSAPCSFRSRPESGKITAKNFRLIN